MPARSTALALALAVVLAACGDTESPSTTTSATDPTTSTTAPLDSDTTVTIEDGTTISVTVTGGEPGGGVQRVTVQRDEQVTLHVTSDEADEVHVHGYDLTADVGPGAPATIEFLADIPGQFEIEMEGSHILVVDLTVT